MTIWHIQPGVWANERGIGQALHSPLFSPFFEFAKTTSRVRNNYRSQQLEGRFAGYSKLCIFSNIDGYMQTGRIEWIVNLI